MMHLAFSDSEFKFPNLGGGYGICSVRVFIEQQTKTALVLVIEDDRNDEHTSITNAATEIAAKIKHQVLGEYGFLEMVLWLEVYANYLHPEPTFDWMEFDPGFDTVTWKPASRHFIEQLIGAPLEGIPEGDERANVESKR